jgi:hypothetical protein
MLPQRPHPLQCSHQSLSGDRQRWQRETNVIYVDSSIHLLPLEDNLERAEPGQIYPVQIGTDSVAGAIILEEKAQALFDPDSEAVD